MYVRPKTENNLKKVMAIRVIKNNPLFQCEKNLSGMKKARLKAWSVIGRFI